MFVEALFNSLFIEIQYLALQNQQPRYFLLLNISYIIRESTNKQIIYALILKVDYIFSNCKDGRS